MVISYKMNYERKSGKKIRTKSPKVIFVQSIAISCQFSNFTASFKREGISKEVFDFYSIFLFMAESVNARPKPGFTLKNSFLNPRR